MLGLCELWLGGASRAALLHSVHSRGEASRVVRLVSSKGRMGLLRAKTLPAFAMLVSYMPLARTGLARWERVPDAVGGVKEVFGWNF